MGLSSGDDFFATPGRFLGILALFRIGEVASSRRHWCRLALAEIRRLAIRLFREQPLNTIRSLHYLLPVIDEARHSDRQDVFTLTPEDAKRLTDDELQRIMGGEPIESVLRHWRF